MVIGDRRAGEFPAIEGGRSGQERRGQPDRRRGLDRRQENEHVLAEQRIGFDRRAMRERPAGVESPARRAVEREAMPAAPGGLFNRRYLEAGLRREVERCRRYRATTSVLMFDLDHFKATNDRYGHHTGDLVLKTLGELIAQHLRAVDIPCRYGGDEVAVVLPDSDRG